MIKSLIAIFVLALVSSTSYAGDAKPGDITFMDEELINNSRYCLYIVSNVHDPIRIICNGKNAIQFQPAKSFSGFDTVHTETRAIIVSKTIELLTQKGFKVLGSNNQPMDLVSMTSITFLKP